jgi:hypothetical protein
VHGGAGAENLREQTIPPPATNPPMPHHLVAVSMAVLLVTSAARAATEPASAGACAGLPRLAARKAPGFCAQGAARQDGRIGPARPRQGATLGAPVDIKVDAKGDVYIADDHTGRVLLLRYDAAAR